MSPSFLACIIAHGGRNSEAAALGVPRQKLQCAYHIHVSRSLERDIPESLLTTSDMFYDKALSFYNHTAHAFDAKSWLSLVLQPSFGHHIPPSYSHQTLFPSTQHWTQHAIKRRHGKSAQTWRGLTLGS